METDSNLVAQLVIAVSILAHLAYKIWDSNQARKRVEDNPGGYQSNASVIASNERVTKHISSLANNIDKLVDVTRDLSENQRLSVHETERIGRAVDWLVQNKAGKLG